VPDPEGIEEGPFKLPFMIGTLVEDWASEPRPDGPCAVGGMGSEGSAIEVLDLIWVAALPDCAAGSCGGGFIGREGL